MIDKPVMIITGTRKGIGKYLAEYYTEKGFIVIGCSRGDIDFALNNYQHYCLDVCDESLLKKMFREIRKKHGRLDVLINNAAISQEKSFEKISDADWDHMLVSNLRGAFSFSQEVIPHMIKSKWGRIVNVVSIGGQWGGRNQIHYAASKAGLINLTTSLAKLYSKNGITINAVSPGLVKTEMIANELKTTSGKNKIKQIPIGRIADTDEVANVVNFLCSDEASYITGQTINVNGGMYP